MKDKFLKMAGVNSEKEFYNMFPTEEAFFKAYPQAVEMKSGGGYRKAQTGGALQDEQMFQYPNYNQNMLAYAQRAYDDKQNNPMRPITNMFKTGAMALGQAADNGSGKAMDAIKLAGSLFGMPAMQMGGTGMMMRDNYYDEGGEMAIGQIMAMHDRLSNLQKFVNTESEVEPWVASKLTLADDYLNSVSDYMQYNQGSGGLEEEEDTDMTMGEMQEMKMGGIPQRYKSRGFTKVGAKRNSDRAGKKWMVLAKKGDKYKIVHGGYVGMKDFSQHGSNKRKDNFWNRMGGRDSAKATDPFSPLYWHKRFGTWAYGGDISDVPINASMSPGVGTDPRFEQYYNQQLQNLNMSGTKYRPTRNDVYSYYQSSNPQSAVDQTGRMIFSTPKGTISTVQGFSQAVDDKTGQVLDQSKQTDWSNVQKSLFDQEARKFYSGGQPVQKADPMQPVIDAEKKAKRRDALKTAGIAAGAIGTAIFDSVRQYQEDLGWSKWQDENKNYEASDVPSNKGLRKIGRRANGGDTDMYGGQMDMDAMYQNMKHGGQPCYNCGGKVYQQGGQGQGEDQVMQAIQMYAQMTQTDPEQLMAQLQALPPLEQQEAIQQIMQAIQQQQSQSPDSMAYGGININSANFARNSRGLKKQTGGMTQGSELELDDNEIQNLIDQGYGIEYLD